MNKLRLYVWLGWLLIGVSIMAQEDFMFKTLEVKDGLPNNQVNDIFKDSRGYMWFATSSGLVRYDGYNFKLFRQQMEEEHSLPDNFVEHIEEDAQGYLWMRVGVGEYTLYNYRTEAFDVDVRAWLWRIGIDGMPQRMLIDHKKDFWFFVLGKGLYHYRYGWKLAELLPSEQAHFPTNFLTDMQECSEGILLVYDDGTVMCVGREQLQVKWTLNQIRDSLLPGQNDSFFMFVDRDEELWVYSALGTWIYNLKTHQWHPKPFWMSREESGEMVTTIAQDSKGRIWLGRNQTGITVLDKRTGLQQWLCHQADNSRSLPHNTINTLYVDDDGVVWVGTYKKGVAYYDESIFKFSFYQLGDIHCIEEAEQNCLWLGTNDGGLIHWNPRTGQKRTYRHEGEQSLTVDVVVSLLKASDGKLWIGTFWGGLDCFDGQHFVHYRNRPNDANSLANNNVWALAEDAQGNIWIGTLGGGLQCLHPKTGTFTTYNMSNSRIASNHIASLCVARGNQLIIGTASSGVSVMDLTTKEITNQVAAKASQGRFSNESVNQVYEDSRGLVWIASRGGLAIYNPKSKASQLVMPTSKGQDQYFSSVVEDAEKNIWVTTSQGVVNILPQFDSKQGNYQFTFRFYNEKDGLQSCEFNQRSIKYLSSGAVVMGGLYGLNSFRPENIRYNSQDPKVLFTEFLLFNEPVQIGTEYDGQVILAEALAQNGVVSLSYHQNIFSVMLATDSYLLPEKTRYLYHLEGFDDSWMQVPADMHRITYTNLAPGTYHLHVKAVNSDGLVGTQVSTLKIIILPPFWRTGWAYLCYLLLFLGVLLAGFLTVQRRERNKYRIRQLQQDVQKTEELNQLKFRFFTNVSHELRTPLTLILSPLETLLQNVKEGAQKEQLQMIHRNAQRLLYLVNQLLDFRKNEMATLHPVLSEGDVVLFVRNICQSFLSFSERKHVHLTFFSAIDNLIMAFDDDKLGKVIMNLLSNAFKFTPDGGRVDVSLQLQTGTSEVLEIRVADTGIGISDVDKEHIFDRFFQVDQDAEKHTSTGSGIGLSLVRDYITLLGGTVSVTDNAGGGSVFMVCLPVQHLDMPSVAVSETVASSDTVSGSALQAPLAADLSDGMPESVKTIEVKDAEPLADRRKPLVLVVDDNDDMLTLLRSNLSLYYRVRTAVNGKEAWKLLSTLKPDLIVSDVMMPVMDGNELCRLVKEHAETEHIPFVLLTAKQAMEDKVEGLKLGADDYVTKPFNLEVLTLRIRKLIDWSHRSKDVRKQINPEPSKITITSLDEQLVANAIKYVETNISRPELSVEELSQALGMSRVHLYKKLSQITGKTPVEFIRIIRLKRGMQLLRESQLNVSEIAYQVGFNSPKYFTKYFREEFGVLPSVYQEKEGV